MNPLKKPVSNDAMNECKEGGWESEKYKSRLSVYTNSFNATKDASPQKRKIKIKFTQRSDTSVSSILIRRQIPTVTFPLMEKFPNDFTITKLDTPTPCTSSLYLPTLQMITFSHLRKKLSYPDYEIL